MYNICNPREKKNAFGSVVEQEQQENYSTAIPNVMGIQNKLSKQPACLSLLLKRGNKTRSLPVVKQLRQPPP
jgi:hypothetical protein